MREHLNDWAQENARCAAEADPSVDDLLSRYACSHPGVEDWYEIPAHEFPKLRAAILASAGQADRYRSYFGDKHPGDVHQELLSAYAEIERLKVAAPTPAAAQGEPTVPQLLENADDVRRLLQSMHVSSSVFVDCEGNITGYKINTGALHKLFGMFGVVTYTGLPEIEEQPAAAPKQDEKPIPPTRDYESQVDESFAVVRAAVAAQDSCITNKFSSRVCERGTKSCNVEHAAAQDGPKCRACNGNDGDIPCAYPEGHPHCLRNIAAKGSGGHD